MLLQRDLLYILKLLWKSTGFPNRRAQSLAFTPPMCPTDADYVLSTCMCVIETYVCTYTCLHKGCGLPCPGSLPESQVGRVTCQGVRDRDCVCMSLRMCACVCLCICMGACLLHCLMSRARMCWKQTIRKHIIFPNKLYPLADLHIRVTIKLRIKTARAISNTG